MFELYFAHIIAAPEPTCAAAGVDAGCCPDNAPECDLGECRCDFLCNELGNCCSDVPAIGTYLCCKSAHVYSKVSKNTDSYQYFILKLRPIY